MATKKTKSFCCTYCDKTFAMHNQLVIHIRQHTGEKPYKCEYCQKGFASVKVLKVHERIHTGERPYKCPYCDKSFSAYANLVVHRRIHTNEKPYQCKLCKRAFEHSGNLSRHFRAHITDYGFRCILCAQTFPEGHLLLEHTKEEHNNDYISYIMNNKKYRHLTLSPSGIMKDTSELPDQGNNFPNTSVGKVKVDSSICKAKLLEDITKLNKSEKLSGNTFPESLPRSSSLTLPSPEAVDSHQTYSDSSRMMNPSYYDQTQGYPSYVPQSSYSSSYTPEYKTEQNEYEHIYHTDFKGSSEYKRFTAPSNESEAQSIQCSSTSSDSASYITKIDPIYDPIESNTAYSDPPPLIPIDEIDEHDNFHTNEFRSPLVNESTMPYTKMETSNVSIYPNHECNEHLGERDAMNDMSSEYHQQTSQTNDTEKYPNRSKDQNNKMAIRSFLESQFKIFAFRKKVERAICCLIGKEKLKEFGYPEKCCEQVLIHVLDSVNKSPCADVRVVESERFKINVRLLIEKIFPRKQDWERLGWKGKSIDFILDQIIAYEN